MESTSGSRGMLRAVDHQCRFPVGKTWPASTRDRKGVLIRGISDRSLSAPDAGQLLLVGCPFWTGHIYSLGGSYRFPG